MQVRLAREGAARGGADHVRRETPLRGCLDAEIAVLEEGPQTALEVRALGVAGDEALRAHVDLPVSRARTRHATASLAGVATPWRWPMRTTAPFR